MTRCNCENSSCSHEPGECWHEAGNIGVMYIGFVCTDCLKKQPAEYHVKAEPYIGLDYSHGKANFNPETGIHFGIIPVHEVDWWWDSTEYVSPPYACECGMVIEDPTDGDECPDCEEVIDLSFYEGPSHHAIEDNKYSAENDDSMAVWVYKSPYFTTTMYCSPCAPGAGHLGSPHPDGIKTYCLGHEWFDGPAPYPVYSVKTGELVPYKKED